MPATLQERLRRCEADELRNFAVELGAPSSSNSTGMVEKDVRRRADLAQQLVDHVLGIPRRMRQTVQDSKASASAGKLIDLKEAGEALTSLLSQYTQVVKLSTSVAAGIRDAGYPVERVEQLPAAIAEMVELMEETIETWPWPEDWWPPVDREMLNRSYEKEDFLTREEASRELLRGTPE